MKAITYLTMLVATVGLCFIATAQLMRNPGFVGGLQSGAAGGGGLPNGNILAETFEGTGFSTSGWSKNVGAGSTVDEDYTTTPGTGSQCLRLVQAGDSGSALWALPVGTNEIWIRLQLRIVSGSQRVLSIMGTGATGLVSVNLSSGTMNIRDETGGQNLDNTNDGTMSTGQWYYVWVHYLKGTGANAVCECAFSTTTTRPSYTTVSNGASTLAVVSILVGNNSVQTGEQLVDEVNAFNYAQ